MKIQKLDNRFKLKKAGLASYMVVTSMNDSFPIQKKLEEAYGIGAYIAYGRRSYHIPVNRDWYYSHKVRRSSTIEAATLYNTCIYLRREEQATYLLLAMAT